MAIKIQTEKTSIPIELGDLEFEFDVTDESIVKFRKDAENIQKELLDIEVNEDDDKALEQTKDVLRRGYELMLGKGSFEKVYKLSPSVMICMRYLEQIVEGIRTELEKMGFSETQKEKAQKYIQKKKK